MVRKINQHVVFAIVDHRYIKDDLPVINHYNSKIRKETEKISTEAIFEFGLMGRISSSILLVCNANSGLAPRDSEVLNDPQMIALADSIRSGKSDVNITISSRARERRYPMFTWADKYYSAKRENLISLLMNETGISDKDKLYEWFSHCYAMRDIFYYHSHSLNMCQWEKSCEAVTSKRLLPHQKQTLDDVREAISRNKPIVLGLGRQKWLEYVPELVNYENAYAFCQYCWFTSSNLVRLSDYSRFRSADRNKQNEIKQRGWTAFASVIRGQIRKLK